MNLWRLRKHSVPPSLQDNHVRAEEYYFVLSGRGVAVLDGEDYPLSPGDFLRLPPRTTHGFITGDEPLEMLDVHTPGSRPDRDVYFVDGQTPAGFGTAGS